MTESIVMLSTSGAHLGIAINIGFVLPVVLLHVHCVYGLSSFKPLVAPLCRSSCRRAAIISLKLHTSWAFQCMRCWDGAGLASRLITRRSQPTCRPLGSSNSRSLLPGRCLLPQKRPAALSQSLKRGRILLPHERKLQCRALSLRKPRSSPAEGRLRGLWALQSQPSPCQTPRLCSHQEAALECIMQGHLRHGLHAPPSAHTPALRVSFGFVKSGCLQKALPYVHLFHRF